MPELLRSVYNCLDDVKGITSAELTEEVNKRSSILGSIKEHNDLEIVSCLEVLMNGDLAFRRVRKLVGLELASDNPRIYAGMWEYLKTLKRFEDEYPTKKESIPSGKLVRGLGL